MSITIYHNPDCGTSRNTLALIRNSGAEPTIIYYLETPPSVMSCASCSPRWGSRCARCCGKRRTDALGLAEDRFTDDQIIDFMLQHPILINRPIVTTPQGADSAARQRWCWRS